MRYQIPPEQVPPSIKRSVVETESEGAGTGCRSIFWIFAAIPVIVSVIYDVVQASRGHTGGLIFDALLIVSGSAMLAVSWWRYGGPPKADSPMPPDQPADDIANESIRQGPPPGQ